MIQPQTEREKVFIEEMYLAREERDKYQNELNRLKQLYKEDIKLGVIIGKKTELAISKGNATVSLDRDQLDQLFKYAKQERFV